MKTKLLIYLGLICLLFHPNVSFGQAPNLGTTSSFAAFTAVGAFTNTGASLVTGDVGTNVGAFTGFPPGMVIGQTHVADVVSATAAADVALAYSNLASRTCGSVISTTLGSGQTLTPGVYCLGAASTLNGNLILDASGDPNGLFIFLIDGALSTTTLSSISLISTSACNVFWQVNGQVDLGAGSTFVGTILANGAINLLEAAQLNGKALSQAGAISLNNNIVNSVMNPTHSKITGPTTLCAGGSIVLSGNVNGTWSTGATSPTITVTAAGDYFVTNTNACGSVTSNHIVVALSPPPVASTITGPTALCAGGSIVLSGNVGGTWSTGAITPTITVTTPGHYFVTNTNDCGTVTSNHIIVTLSNPPVASTIIANGPTAFCVPGSVVLSGNVGGTWSTGSSTPTITVTTPGDYFVTNTNDCGTITSNHIMVTLSNPPVAAIITANGPTAFCVPGSVVLSGNVGGTWSTGASTPTITVTTPGDYFVTNTNDCGTITSNHIMVTLSNPPVAAIITANGPTEFCGCGTVVLSGNNCGTWSTGETTESITVTKSGDYYVTCMNDCGSVTSNHIIVKMNELPVAAIITANGPTEFCGCESSVVLSGNNCGIWSTGETTESITVTKPGDYYVTCTYDCGTVTSNHITVTMNLLPVAAIITAKGPTTFSAPGSVVLVGNVGGTWSTGETTGSITVTTSGDYYVVNRNSCGCVTSNHIIVTVSNVSSVPYANTDDIVSIYPNPSSMAVIIDLNLSQFENVEFKLYNASGANVMNETLIEKMTTVKTRNLDSGFYFYKLIDKDKVIKSGKLLFKK